MRENEVTFRRLVEDAPDIIFRFQLEPERGFEFLSPAVTDVLGYTPEGVYSRPDFGRGLVHPDDCPDFGELSALPVRRTATYRLRLVHRDGSTVWAEARLNLVVGAAGTRSIEGIVRDVTALQAAETELRHLALHDPGTGLPNRRLLQDYLQRSVHAVGRSDRLLALLVMDLDRFKDVNDSLGHATGDRLLSAVARRLTAALRPQDILARLGGDEFAAALSDVIDASDATQVAARLQAQLREPFALDHARIFVTASIGIAVTSKPDRNPDGLLHDADVAMYRAKARGGDRVEVFDEVLQARVAERLETTQDLHAALAHGQFRLVYQPTVALETDAIIGVEALLRWHRPGHGSVPAAAFLDVADHTGLIVPIGRWALHEACRQFAAWQQSRLTNKMCLTVNVSARELADPAYTSTVTAALAAAHLPPHILVLDLGDAATTELTTDARATLDRLAALGVNIAIDNFGTGVASLTLLRDLPVHLVKIAPGITTAAHNSPSDTTILGAIIEIAHILQLITVAQRVEDTGQLETLRRHGCDLAQGYLLAKPQPADAVARLLRAQATSENPHLPS